jgi:hypothetical protein
MNSAHNIQIDTETLTLTTSAPRMQGPFKTWSVAISHPDGGSLSVDVVGARGEWIVCCPAPAAMMGVPSEVWSAIKDLFHLASHWQSARPMGEAYDIDAAICAALAL